MGGGGESIAVSFSPVAPTVSFSPRAGGRQPPTTAAFRRNKPSLGRGGPSVIQCVCGVCVCVLVVVVVVSCERVESRRGRQGGQGKGKGKGKRRESAGPVFRGPCVLHVSGLNSSLVTLVSFACHLQRYCYDYDYVRIMWALWRRTM